jgi:hypothetical protein
MTALEKLDESDRRLFLLVVALRAWPKERFDYTSWVGSNWKPAMELADPSCGSTACALGIATTVPELQALGLRLSKNGIPVFGDGFQEEDAFDAAWRVFLLGTIEEAEFLFCPLACGPSGHVGLISPPDDASAADVADHLLQFICRRRERSSLKKHP